MKKLRRFFASTTFTKVDWAYLVVTIGLVLWEAVDGTRSMLPGGLLLGVTITQIAVGLIVSVPLLLFAMTRLPMTEDLHAYVSVVVLALAAIQGAVLLVGIVGSIFFPTFIFDWGPIGVCFVLNVAYFVWVYVQYNKPASAVA